MPSPAIEAIDEPAESWSGLEVDPDSAAVTTSWSLCFDEKGTTGSNGDCDSPETAEKLNMLADQMTHAAEDGNDGVLKRLRDPVASLIRQVYTRAQSIEQVGAAKGFGGLLGDKRSKSP